MFKHTWKFLFLQSAAILSIVCLITSVGQSQVQVDSFGTIFSPEADIEDITNPVCIDGFPSPCSAEFLTVHTGTRMPLDEYVILTIICDEEANQPNFGVIDQIPLNFETGPLQMDGVDVTQQERINDVILANNSCVVGCGIHTAPLPKITRTCDNFQTDNFDTWPCYFIYFWAAGLEGTVDKTPHNAMICKRIALPNCDASSPPAPAGGTPIDIEAGAGSFAVIAIADLNQVIRVDLNTGAIMASSEFRLDIGPGIRVADLAVADDRVFLLGDYQRQNGGRVPCLMELDEQLNLIEGRGLSLFDDTGTAVNLSATTLTFDSASNAMIATASSTSGLDGDGNEQAAGISVTSVDIGEMPGAPLITNWSRGYSAPGQIINSHDSAIYQTHNDMLTLQFRVVEPFDEPPQGGGFGGFGLLGPTRDIFGLADPSGPSGGGSGKAMEGFLTIYTDDKGGGGDIFEAFTLDIGFELDSQNPIPINSRLAYSPTEMNFALVTQEHCVESGLPDNRNLNLFHSSRYQPGTNPRNSCTTFVCMDFDEPRDNLDDSFVAEATGLQALDCTQTEEELDDPLLFDACTSPEGFVEDEIVDAITTFRGVKIAGGLADVQDSDDTRARYNPGFTLNDEEKPVWILADKLNVEEPSQQLRLAVESQAGTPGLSKQIELFNFDTGDFDLIVGEVDESFNNDSVLRALICRDDVAQYVADADQPAAGGLPFAAAGTVRMRVGWRQTGFTINFPWEVRIDHFSIDPSQD